jgi:dolichol-phosphate mannosyltransferase
MRVVNIIPTYNEKENIGLMLQTLERIAKENPKYEFLTLVVDANSTDGTQEIVKEFIQKNKKIFLLTGPKRGLGYDLIRGYRYAMEKLNADVVIPNDADFQWDPNYIPQLLKKIDEGYDVVVASRHIKGGEAEKWSWFRKLNHWLANTFFAGIVAGVKEVKDHTGCFKAIRVKDHLEKVPLEKLNVKGFVIQNQILYELSKTGAKFAEVPVKFQERKRGASKVGFNKQYLKDTIEWIKSCILIRLERSQRFLKFGTVGFIGYLVNALGLEIFYRLGLSPGPAAALGAELASVSKNYWI